MKPRFALDLSNEAIRLLERQAEGWAEIGSADLSDPRLDRRLATLRSRAEAQAPDGFCTKLILPNSQILYMTLDAPGPDAQARRAQIRRGLEGRTPYAVDDLTFDWSGSGASVRVAVLANVTLDEAETFAEAYGFRPAAFVAVPQDGTFGGEPFFGLTSMAARHLPPGLRYDRDQDPVRMIRLADPVADDPDENETADDAAPFDHDALPAQDTTAAAEPVSDLAANLADEAVLDDLPDVPVPEDDAGVEPAPVDADAELPESALVAPAEFAEAAALFAIDPAGPGSSAADDRNDDVLPHDKIAEAASADDLDGPIEPEAPFTAIEGPDDDAPEPFSGQPSEQVTGSALPDDPDQDAGPDGPADVPVPDVAPPAQGFQSRRQPGQSGSEGEHIAHVVHRLGGLHAGPENPPQTPAPRLTMTAARSVARQSADRATDARTPMRRLGTAMVEFRSRAGQAAASAGRVGAQRLIQLGGHVPGLRDKAPDRTIFGAPVARGDWRRVGAAGAVAAILVAATVGLWTLAFSSNDESVQSRPDQPGQSAEPAEPPATTASDADQGAAAPSAPRPDPAPDALPPGVDVAAPAEPSGAVADRAANLAALAPDTLPEPADPSALPGELLAGDRPLPSQPLPQPFGTSFTYDPDGLIEATPEGVVTPGGFTLVAGRPARTPPVRPARIADAIAPVAPPADATLAGKRPKPKPPALLALPPASPETEAAVADAALPPTPAPPVDPRHGALKPRARPDSVAEAAVQLRENAARLAEAAEAAARAEAEAFEAALRGATPQAVASSRRPAVRPAGIAAVAATLAAANEPPPVDGTAVEAALAEAQAEPQVAAAPEPPPEALDEPEPEEGIATLPTTRTVAKQSTIANAIDLGDVNLIGVYGSSANRRALVRMPNGRYVKVQVGDRLDGGKVAAIGDNELSYVKRGQTIVLKMLKKG